MDEFDEADLDGDGEFDAIDIEILEDGEEEKPVLERTGCAFILFGIGSSLGIGWWGVNSYLA